MTPSTLLPILDFYLAYGIITHKSNVVIGFSEVILGMK